MSQETANLSTGLPIMAWITVLGGSIVGVQVAAHRGRTNPKTANAASVLLLVVLVMGLLIAATVT